ncbi:ATP-binding protein [Paraburkholderia sacchari]|uniref:ATP-binding protein n=1 Tax=Paraburkholderia sacchari TaxID=159450 RepID=A0A8T6ZCZ0_9BURK|nr:ATP-binding protein [Paraburkholderia sacchari]NLP62646.1 ATP-binding protein [Paraburkholderia sacchari]
MNVSDRFDTQLTVHAPDIGGLVDSLDIFFAAHGLPHALLQSFAMAFDEVVSNIAAYGSAQQPIRIHVTVAADEVWAQVIDDGVAFDPLQLADPDVTSGVEDRAIGGLGVFLVKKMMDEVAYERREPYNCLSFAKRIAPARN